MKTAIEKRSREEIREAIEILHEARCIANDEDVDCLERAIYIFEEIESGDYFYCGDDE